MQSESWLAAENDKKTASQRVVWIFDHGSRARPKRHENLTFEFLVIFDFVAPW